MKTFICLLILIASTHCFSQSGSYCGNKKKLSIVDIKKLFPYNQTTSIKLVAFPNNGKDEIPKATGRIDFTKMVEIKTLDIKLTDKLLDISVNYDNENRAVAIEECYEPHNGIVFLDKGKNILGYVEICFLCSRYEINPKNMAVSSSCDEKLDALKRIFKEAGITYGTDTR